MKSIEPKRIKLFPKQYDFFFLQEREALLEAGIGYGKSRVASLWLAHQTQEHPGTRWIMAARDYRQLKTSIDAEFEYYLIDILGLERNIDYAKTSGSPIHYKFRNGSEIYGFGAVNYDTAFRSGNYSGAWGDEVDFWNPEAVNSLRGRIRVAPELVRWTSSPNGFNHVYEDFYKKKVGPIINASSFENPTLSPEYIESLRASYDERLFKQEVMAERLSLTAGRVYYAFDRDKHVTTDTQFNKQYPVWAGVDFNVDPMTASIGQLVPVIGGHQLLIIDEVFLRHSNTEALALAIKAKYGPEVSIVPDSTGIKRTTNANISDIQILKNHFTKVMPGLNPYRVDRYASVNGAFANNKVLISSKCINLIKDLETLAYKQGSDEPDTSISHLLTHSSDNLGYLIFKTINPLKTGAHKISSSLR